MSEFEEFQLEFKKWQKLFGLTGYKVYFKYENLNNCFAEITVQQTDMVATVTLNKRLPAKDKPHKDITRTAKHEAIHLMLSKLENLGKSRYVQPEEIYEATEELVFKLEELIKE